MGEALGPGSSGGAAQVEERSRRRARGEIPRWIIGRPVYPQCAAERFGTEKLNTTTGTQDRDAGQESSTGSRTGKQGHGRDGKGRFMKRLSATTLISIGLACLTITL